MMLGGDYPPAFDVQGLRKDLALIVAAAEQAGIATELARAILERRLEQPDGPRASLL